jgi:hypothetical protein
MATPPLVRASLYEWPAGKVTGLMEPTSLRVLFTKVTLCLSSSEAWGSGLVEGAVAEHGEQDADVVAGQAEQGLGVGVPTGSASVVVDAGGGIVQGGEGGHDLDGAVAAAVRERTEGWAAGLQPAALTLRADPDKTRADDRHPLHDFTAEV